jgi:hypothetical protein
MIYNRNSDYVKFAEKYCEKMNLVALDATGHKVYNEIDLWEAFLIKRDYDNRNRQGK